MLFTLIAMTLSAHAAPGLSVVCGPDRPLAPALRVSWDTLTAVDSVQVTAAIQEAPVITIRSRILTDGSASEKRVADVYNIDQRDQAVLVRDDSQSSGLHYDSVTFVMTDIKAPPSAGPIPPGDYPATASLVLVASHRPGPGEPNVVETRKVDLGCVYSVRYQ